MTTKQLERATLATLWKIDVAQDASYVREIEMTADTALTSPGYSVQFWRDVQVYGMREAILYVRNGNHGDADALLTKWNEIQARIIGKGI